MRYLIWAKANDIIKGFDLIGSLIDFFANVRHDIDNYHEKWYKEALELAKVFNIVEVVPTVSSRQHLSFKFLSSKRFKFGILQTVLSYPIGWHSVGWIEDKV